MNLPKEDSIIGCLLGTAVGDALGLCCEGMSKKRQGRMFPEVDNYHFFFGRGMISDDTEHTCMVAQALIVSGGDVDIFTKSLAWRLRFWILGLPAGIGLATLRSLLKLWIGFPGHMSGVFSAGNGPAMRSAVIGAAYGDDGKKMRELVRASTRITHTDPKAEFGSLAVALAAHLASKSNKVCADEFFSELKRALEGDDADEFIELMNTTVMSAKQRETSKEFAEKLGQGKGISGYMYDTVPMVIHSWLGHQGDFPAAVREIIHCGGDTDTTAAILGGIMGAGVGKDGIPEEWLGGIWEWPRTVKWMEELGQRLALSAKGETRKALRLPVWGILVRNVFFLIVVLAHGFRRMLPPY